MPVHGVPFGTMMDVDQPIDVVPREPRAHAAELGPKMLDWRGLAKPPMFSGQPPDWAEFRFRLEATATMMGLDEMMDRAAVNGDIELSAAEQLMSRLLYALLVQLVQGRALALVRLVPRHHGVKAWNALVQEYEPNLAARFCAQLSAILVPDWKNRDDADFTELLLKWERSVNEYEIATGVPMPPAYKCAIVQNNAPPLVQELLRCHPEELMQDYGRMREVLRTFRIRGIRYDATGAALPGAPAFVAGKIRGLPSGTVPMEIGAVVPQGAGRGSSPWYPGGKGDMFLKGKGKGKKGGGKAGKGKKGDGKASGGKGKSFGGQQAEFQGKCYHCGIQGHRANECRRVMMLEDSYVESAEDDAEVAGVQLQTEEVMAIERSTAHVCREWLLMVDSGSYTHVAPPWFADGLAMKPVKDGQPSPVAADGRELRVYGERRVPLVLENGDRVTVLFRVLDVKRPILSVSELCKHGVTVKFQPSHGTMVRNGKSLPLVTKGSLQFLPVRLDGQNVTVKIPAQIAEVKETKKPWMLYEWACEPDSALAEWFMNAGHAACRLHLPRWDLRDPHRIEELIDAMVRAASQGFNLFMWVSLPCTPWSRWQSAICAHQRGDKG